MLREIPDKGDLILCRSQPARFMRFKNFEPDKMWFSFKIGENEFGDRTYHCQAEYYEDMLRYGHWEIVDSEVVE